MVLPAVYTAVYKDISVSGAMRISSVIVRGTCSPGMMLSLNDYSNGDTIHYSDKIEIQ